MGFSILLDDANPWIPSYYGTQWVHNSGLNSSLGIFNSTLSICNAKIQNTTYLPRLSINFYGSEFHLYGQITSDVELNYMLDGTILRPAVLSTAHWGVGKSGINNIWNIQALNKTAHHTLEIFPSSGLFALDYITITPTEYSNLTGFNLIIDDNDPSLERYYSGNWKPARGENFGLGGVPYKATMTGTNTIGSKLNFDFIGSSVSVFGSLNQQAGKLTAAFSVDGKTAATFTPFDGSQTVNTSSWLHSQRFFHQDLTPGNHSLLITLNEVTESQMLWIDAIIFEGTNSTFIGEPSGTGVTSTSNDNLKLSNSAIAGIAFAGIFLLFILAVVKNKIRPSPTQWMSIFTAIQPS